MSKGANSSVQCLVNVMMDAGNFALFEVKTRHLLVLISVFPALTFSSYSFLHRSLWFVTLNFLSKSVNKLAISENKKLLGKLCMMLPLPCFKEFLKYKIE